MNIYVYMCFYMYICMEKDRAEKRKEDEYEAGLAAMRCFSTAYLYFRLCIYMPMSSYVYMCLYMYIYIWRRRGRRKERRMSMRRDSLP